MQFCRLLRARELLVTPSEALDAVRALEVVEVARREEFYWALRTVLTSSPDDVATFDEVFDAFWTAERIMELGAVAPPTEPPAADGAPPPEARAPGQHVELAATEADEQEAEAEEQEVALYSPVEVLAQKDFGDLGAAELGEVTRLAQRIARRLALRLSRRMRAARRGHLVDARRTMRRSLRYGGTALELVRRRRRILKPELALICDISRSMDTYSQFLLLFAYALQLTPARVETFVFSTQLSRITPLLRGEWADVLAALGATVRHWSGGTRIGQCLQEFNDSYAPAVVGPRTVVVVLSDGLDTGDIAALDAALADLKRRAGRLVWLNPYAGRASYQPLARGMATALPYVDVFASAHNLATLSALERYILRGNGG
ncbi:MAG: VWA domain-containing protein [Chloroflexi bacterium]|nr:VWA domain-containing protein [Chloroflexota bacterium]